MTGERCSRGAPFGDLLDYWADDLDQHDAERVEAHVFECAECANRLADIATVADAVADAVRGARVQSVISDTVLNKLSRDGVRVRTYAPRTGHVHSMRDLARRRSDRLAAERRLQRL
jgi:anti-sigma factor RsiW